MCPVDMVLRFLELLETKRGDDGTRTRGICRDSECSRGNCLKNNGADRPISAESKSQEVLLLDDLSSVRAFRQTSVPHLLRRNIRQVTKPSQTQ